MKTTNILYWIFTGLFAAFMGFSGFANTFMIEDSTPVFTALGYPTYLIPFMGILKLLGAVAILIPGFPRIKEWAYAGLFFDLAGATFSSIAALGFKPEMAFMSLFFILEALSYIYYHKRLSASGTLAN